MTTGSGDRRQRRVPGGRSGRVVVKVTEQTHAELADLATAAGLSLPRYLVECALRPAEGGWSLQQQRWWAERLDVVDTRLIRIGANLNQLAAAANAGAVVDGQAVTTAAGYHADTLQQLRHLMTGLRPGGVS